MAAFLNNKKTVETSTGTLWKEPFPTISTTDYTQSGYIGNNEYTQLANVILENIKGFAVSIIHWNMTEVGKHLFVLIPFGIGVVTGVILISKVIEMLFKKYPVYVYWAILGLLVASPFAIFVSLGLPPITAVRILTGAVTFVVGFLISGRLTEK